MLSAVRKLLVSTLTRVLDKQPVTIKLLKAPKPTMSFYDVEDNEQAMVLPGSDAGLRGGEILALSGRTWTSGEDSSTSGSSSGRGTLPCPRAGVTGGCP